MPNNPRCKWIKRLSIAGVLLIAIWLISCYVVVFKFTRRPRSIFAETVPVTDAGKIEPLRFTTSDGQQIGAWFIDGKPNRPIVLLLHGYGGCRIASIQPAELVEATGCGALMISMRGHGDSTGDFVDFGFGSRHDVVAAVDWLKINCPNRPIVVWGQSLGSAAALFAAEELGDRVSGYILECPFRDLHTAVWNRLHLRLPPLLDWVAYTGMKIVAPLVISDTEKISPLRAAEKMPPNMPVLVLAGSADQRALVVESQDICDCCKKQSQLVIFNGADHMKLFETDEASYRKSVLEFIERCSAEQHEDE
jgi:uncharacterized protein